MDLPASIFQSERECLNFWFYSIYARDLAETCRFSMAVWGHRRCIVIPLTLVILGHWSLLLEGGCRLCFLFSIPSHLPL